MFFEKCNLCSKPLVNEKNLSLLRKLIFGATITGGVIGTMSLPLIGFGFAGVTAGSLAASWQSSIGFVTAGSLFSILQSLGASGLGILLFGSSGVALGLLSSISTRLNWCEHNFN